MALPLRDDQRTRTTPWITLALIAINVAVFLFVQPAGFQGGGQTGSQDQYWLAQERDEFSYRYGAVACEVTTGKVLDRHPAGCDTERPEELPGSKSILLALFTCMFLHGSISHLAGNMLFLWVFGNKVEDRLGHGNFLWLYLAGGVVATLGFVALNPHSSVPLIGASGAIAVAMGAYLVLFPRAQVLTVIFTAAFQVVYVPAVIVLLLFFVTQFFTGDQNVAWEAHAVGMVAGALGALALARVPTVRARAQADEADAAIRAGAEF